MIWKISDILKEVCKVLNHLSWDIPFADISISLWGVILLKIVNATNVDVQMVDTLKGKLVAVMLWRDLLQEGVIVNQYRMILTDHLYPILKHSYI